MYIICVVVTIPVTFKMCGANDILIMKIIVYARVSGVWLFVCGYSVCLLGFCLCLRSIYGIEFW